MHMIGISGRCVTEPNAPPAASTLPLRTPAHVEGARPSPSAKRDAKSAEPKILGGPLDYAMGVFNSCLGSGRSPIPGGGGPLRRYAVAPYRCAAAAGVSCDGPG